MSSFLFSFYLFFQSSSTLISNFFVYWSDSISDSIFFGELQINAEEKQREMK
jgi:hypothetical protein